MKSRSNADISTNLQSPGSDDFKSKHYHGLDALRAFAAFLGFVLHSAMPYIDLGRISIWPVHSQSHSTILYYLVTWIHLFRMPVFFMLAGFFACLIYHNKQISSFISNRFKRIVIPFLVFWLVPSAFSVVTIVLSNLLSHSHFSIHPMYEKLREIGGLWFLYYLILMQLAHILVRFTVNSSSKKVQYWLASCIANLRKVIMMLAFITIAIIALLFGHGLSWLRYPPSVLALHFPLFFFYASFYLAGCMLAKNSDFFQLVTRYSWTFLLLSMVAFGFLLMIMQPYFTIDGMLNLATLCIIYLVSWLTTLALFGLVVRYFQKKSRVITYLAESSYWLYLSQFSVILVMQIILVRTHLPLYSQFILICIGSMAVCLISYAVFIRRRPWATYVDGASIKPNIDADRPVQHAEA